MEVFLSYNRKSAGWVARSLKSQLETRGADVFMDVDDISSGRFENVIVNEIGKRDHFIVLLSPETCVELASPDAWVTRELNRALDLRKNVIPILLDEARIENVSEQYDRRNELLGLNILALSFELFAQAVAALYDRFLSNPTIEEIEIRTAEENFEIAQQEQDRENWEKAEHHYTLAVSGNPRAEYFLGRGVAKHRQGRNDEALSDIDAAIAADPFADELMIAKFDILQNLDRMKEAIALPSQWKQQARQRAEVVGARILEEVSRGHDLLDVVRSIQDANLRYRQMPPFGQVGASITEIKPYVSDQLRSRLEKVWETWKSANDHLRDDWKSTSPPKRHDLGGLHRISRQFVPSRLRRTMTSHSGIRHDRRSMSPSIVAVWHPGISPYSARMGGRRRPIQPDS